MDAFQKISAVKESELGIATRRDLRRDMQNETRSLRSVRGFFVFPVKRRTRV